MHSGLVITWGKRTACWCLYWCSRRAWCYVCNNTDVSHHNSGYVHHRIRNVGRIHTVMFYVWNRCMCMCVWSLFGWPAHVLFPSLVQCHNSMSLLFRLTVSWCGYTGFTPLSVRHFVNGCDLLFLRNVCSTSGIKFVLGCGNIWHAQVRKGFYGRYLIPVPTIWNSLYSLTHRYIFIKIIFT